MTMLNRLATLLAMTLGGCGGGTEPDPPQAGIGPDGGTVTSDDGRATLVVPANALSQSTPIAITARRAASLDAFRIGDQEYQITPAFTLAVPARLTLRYNQAGIPGGALEPDLAVSVNTPGGWAATNGVTVDATGDAASGAVVAGGTFVVRWQGPASCPTPQARQFDFWLGTWDFRQTVGGNGAGVNTIRSEANGCVVTEDFEGQGGYRGRSVNVFQPADAAWFQTYVDTQNARNILRGQFDAGQMSLVENRGAAGLFRAIWRPLSATQIRNYGERSTDGGATWTLVFDATYTKR